MTTRSSISQIESLQEQCDVARRRARATLERVHAAGTAEHRVFTESEKAEIEAHTAEYRAVQQRLDRARGDQAMQLEIDRLGLTRGSGAVGGMSFGHQFLASDTHQWLIDTKKSRSGMWSSPASELSINALLSETGPPALSFPDMRPGGPYYVVPTRPRVADLIAPGTTDGSSVVYMLETGYTNAAATVAEGAGKPESALVLAQMTDPVRKIAHTLSVTDEMLEDANQLRTYLDARMRNGVEQKEDDKLLNGLATATPPDIVGIRNRAGLAVDVVRDDLATPKETNADAIARQIAAIENATGKTVDGIVLNPVNWQTIQLAKAADGTYIGASPFMAPELPRLWGRPVVLTNLIPAGVGLVGAFRTGAQMFRKGGIRVEASNSHADYFAKDLVLVRAESRFALACYYPAAFGEVTGLN